MNLAHKFEVSMNEYIDAMNTDEESLHLAYRTIMDIVSTQAYRDGCEFSYLFENNN